MKLHKTVTIGEKEVKNVVSLTEKPVKKYNQIKNKINELLPPTSIDLNLCIDLKGIASLSIKFPALPALPGLPGIHLPNININICTPSLPSFDELISIESPAIPDLPDLPILPENPEIRGL